MQLSALSPLDSISWHDRRVYKKNRLSDKTPTLSGNRAVKFKRVCVPPTIFRRFFARRPRGQYFCRGWKILIPFGGTLRGTPGRLCYTAGSDPTVSPPSRPPHPRLPTPNSSPLVAHPRPSFPLLPVAPPPPRRRPLEPAELTIPSQSPGYPRALPPYYPSTAPLCKPLVNLLAPL